MKAIDLIKESRGEIKVVDHCLEFIFGYAKKLQYDEEGEDSFELEQSASEEAQS